MLTKNRRPTQGLTAASKNTDAFEFDRRVGQVEAVQITGWSAKSIGRGVQARVFPAPVGFLGLGRTRRRPQWRLSDLLRFVSGEWRAE